MSTIAAIIPAYNEERLILDALESVRNQQRPVDQIVVVDDGSDDRTSCKVQEWSDSFGIEVDLIRKANAGLSAARNTGFQHAKTDYVALLDADDLWYPNHLYTLEEAVDRVPDATLYFGITEALDKSGTVLQYFPGNAIDGTWERHTHGYLSADQSRAYCSLVQGSYIGVSSTLINRLAAKRIGYMDESLRVTGDCDLWIRLSRAALLIHVPIATCAKRVHDRNMTNPRNALKTNECFFRLLHKMLTSNSGVCLTEMERQTTLEVLSRLQVDLMYSASEKGLQAYFKTWLDVVRRRVLTRQLIEPRHFLRATYRSVVGGSV